MWNGEMLNLCILIELNSQAGTHTCSCIRTISAHFMKQNFRQLNCYKKPSKNPQKTPNNKGATQTNKKSQTNHTTKQKNSHLTEVRQWKGMFSAVIPSFGPENIPKQINCEVTSIATHLFRESISSVYKAWKHGHLPHWQLPYSF